MEVELFLVNQKKKNRGKESGRGGEGVSAYPVSSKTLYIMKCLSEKEEKKRKKKKNR